MRSAFQPNRMLRGNLEDFKTLFSRVLNRHRPLFGRAVFPIQYLLIPFKLLQGTEFEVNG